MSSAFEDSNFPVLLVTKGELWLLLSSAGDHKRITTGLRGSQADGELRVGREQGKWKLANMEA